MSTAPVPRPGRGLAVGLSLVVAVAIVILLVTVATPHSAARTEETTPTPSASGSASEPSWQPMVPDVQLPPGDPTYRADDAPPPADHQQMTAASSRLYNAGFPANSQSCRTAAGKLPIRTPPIPDDELADHLQQIVNCLVTVNRPALAAQGITLSTPTVVTFRATVTSACGTQSRNAFYCPDDQSIYVDTLADDPGKKFYATVRNGYVNLISHEFGHHLQLLAGITADYAQRQAGLDRAGQLELSRRLELQATCFQGVFLGATWRELGVTDADYTDLMGWFADNNDVEYGEGTHGSAAAMQRWFRAGFNHRLNTYGRCNTWVVAPAEVA
ncbi:neutral zinc metallopeptidase [Granulicoccus phenolivorans]|uniref:neutral zinc metallopeptidase n=1 Tax=Granulicoccus phenolivorans TaxID=266854 RepID=UPI00040A6721|nr:neutral zinc metallopeptidase [Granulicoccus phenolivorans]